MSKELELVEAFLSIQGEGAYQGRLAIFLRFLGCNLNCSGFGVQTKSLKTGENLLGCDSIRAVFKGHFDHKTYNADEILSLVDNLCKGLMQKPIIVLTGGEPLIWHENENFINLVKKLLEDYEVHFETNGTILVDFTKYEIYKKCHFALGVKLANSGVSEQKRINLDAILTIKNNAKSSFLKFVLSRCDDSELDEIMNIKNKVNLPVWCMAMGADRAELSKNALKTAEFAIKYGFNYSERIHIRLWSDKEGV
ncbi:7-carboxy-7-deazaguanine synthase QueE [Campylobacter concisus]|uniref:7-carboxy-7-deazaguanine synthase QueE n=1 Tax=Campylobacter concisus TaxID=199 RepID=UPI00122C61FD|nr:7-carboxy-7-deazaguanine synthase QueE [Campylobacter concisus]